MKKILKSAMAGVMSAAMAAAGLLLPVSAPVRAAAAVITDFSKENIPVSSFQWEFAERFTKNAVFQDGVLNPEKVTYGNFINEAAAKSYASTKGLDIMKEVAENTIVTGLSETVPDEKPYVLYHGLGSVEENGAVVPLDLKVTLTGWEIAEGTAKEDALVQFSVCAGSAKANYRHDAQAIGIWPSGNVKYIDLRYDFYRAGTSRKYPVSGSFTLVDLDDRQYFSLDSGSGIDAVIRSPGQDRLRADGKDHITMSVSGTATLVQASALVTHPSDQIKDPDAGKTDYFYVKDSYKAGYVSFVFSEKSTIQFRFGSNTVADTINDKSLWNYYYGILPFSVGTYEAPEPEKYVMEPGGTLTKDRTINNGCRKVSYASTVYMPRSLTRNYNYFTFTDTLNEVYDLSQTSVKVYRDMIDGTDVTDWFNVQTEGQTVTVSAKRSPVEVTVTGADGTAAAETITGIADSGSRDFFGHRYYFVIATEIESGLTPDDFASFAANSTYGIQKENDLYIIPNKASCTAGVYHPYDNHNEGQYVNETKKSGEVAVRFTEPKLTVWKEADKAEYDEGDVGHYTVTIRQTIKGAVAENISMEDYLCINDGETEVDRDSVSIYLDGEKIGYDGVKMEENTAYPSNGSASQALFCEDTGVSLAYGHVLTIAYDVLYKEGGTYENEVYISAENAEQVRAEATVVVYDKYSIAVKKKIAADDVNFANGDPVFVMDLSGTDHKGGRVSLHRVLRFTKEDVGAHTDAEGYVCLTAEFADLRAGVYTVTESDDTMRYCFDRLEDVPAFAKLNGAQGTSDAPAEAPEVVIDTAKAGKETKIGVTFVNRQYEAQYFTHTDMVQNRFNTGKKGDADE